MFLLLAFFVNYFLKNSPQQYQLLQAHWRLKPHVFHKISQTSHTKNNQFIFFDCINLSSSFKSIHQPVAFASFQLLQSCSQVIISKCSFSLSLGEIEWGLKNFKIFFVEFFSEIVIFIKIFSKIYFKGLKPSVNKLILFKYSHIAFAVLKIIGQDNQKCVNKSGLVSE